MFCTYDTIVSVWPMSFQLSTDDEDKVKEETLAKEFSTVADFLKKSLGEKVEKVVVSSRLTDSPCALVTSKFGWSANMERIMRTQAMGDTRSMEYMKVRTLFSAEPAWRVVTCYVA